MPAAQKDAALHIDPQTEREMFATAFAHAAPPVQPDGKIIEGQAPREASGASTEAHIKYLARLMAREQGLKAQGIAPATIINLNPYPLRVNSTLIGDIVVDACLASRPYSYVVMKQVRWSQEEGLEGERFPVSWVPLQLAREFSDIYYPNGGVIVYRGDASEEDLFVTIQKDPALKQNFEAAVDRQMAYAREKVREANNEWNTPNHAGARNINDIHRAMAAMLHDKIGLEMPAWMEKVPGQYGLGEQCPQCRAIPQSSAVICPTCAYVLDPASAFEAGTIEVDDVSLRRLDRKQLEAIGIAELIDETIPERNARLRAEAKKIKNQKLRKEQPQGQPVGGDTKPPTA